MQARALLQHVELLDDDPAVVVDAQATIGAVVDRIADLPTGVTWNGLLRGMAANAVGLVLYESFSRRWLQVIEYAEFRARVLSVLSELMAFSHLAAATVRRVNLQISHAWSSVPPRHRPRLQHLALLAW